MKTLLTICALLTCFAPGISQDFQQHQSIALPDTLSHHALQWMDADNDGVLDIVVFSNNALGEEVISLFRNDSLNGVQYAGQFNTGVKDKAHLLADFDGDNTVDVIISGESQSAPLTSVALNKGDFSFQSEPILAVAADLIALGDFDEDGIREMILSGTENGDPFFRILKRRSSGWEVIHDSLKIAARGIEVYDFDADNDQDFFVSGVDDQGLPVSIAFYNQGNFYFTPVALGTPLKGTTVRGDGNGDGNFDITLSGRTAGNVNILRTLINRGAAFDVDDSVISVNDAGVFVADFNSDGLTDLQLSGVLPNADTVNTINGPSYSQELPHAGVVAQAFGDFEHDGDLDVVQLKSTAGTSGLMILRNETTGRNAPPSAPANAISAKIFDRFFLRWNASSDDHTPVSSLTYDVSIQSTAENVVIPAFDLFQSRRLLVVHGNNTTARFVLLRRPEAGPFGFNIQAVDNAFHADKGSVCKGSGGGFNDCVVVATTDVEACTHEQLTLTASSSAEWFSFREGFLGESDALDFVVSQADTVFSVEMQGKGCAKINVYVIQTPPVVKKLVESTVYVCDGQLLHVGVESGWAHVAWSSAMQGALSSADTIDYRVAGADTLKVNLSDTGSCQIQRNMILKISKPQIELRSDAYQILRGESVELLVSGGSSCEWKPALHLSDPRSFSPMASPLTTTEYQVTVSDSLGCTATGRVVVIVEQTAFVPTLFTPNNDGSNDFLKVYGLGQVKDFSFTIFNREGSRVFHTDDVSEVVNVGWNGTFGGVDQPAGLYYWSVKGETGNGKNVQLNGKFSGSIVLLR